MTAIESYGLTLKMMMTDLESKENAVMDYHEDLKPFIQWLVMDTEVTPKTVKKWWELCQISRIDFECRVIDVAYDSLPEEARQIAGKFASVRGSLGQTFLSNSGEATSLLQEVGFLKVEPTHFSMPETVQNRIARRHNACTSITD